MRPLSEIPPIPERAVLDPSMDFKTIPALPLSKMLPTERKKELWIFGIVAGLGILLLVAIFLRRRSMLSHK
jgi:hypothetical protein